jgi:N,N'-diacetylchitobiose transport system permease protein
MTATIEAPPRTRAPERVAKRRRSGFLPYLLVAPTVLATAYLLLYPVLRNIIISMQDFGVRELVRGGARWVGFANYAKVLGDAEFWSVTERTFLFTAANVGLIMVLSTLVAVLLTTLGKVMRLVLMSALVLTWATPVIAATTVFQWLFQSQLGVVNWILVKLGFPGFQGHSWFADGASTFWILVLLIVWQSVPFAALALYSAMTTVPSELYEAARIDGATGLRTFFSITFPILRPMFGLILSLEVIWVFKSFVQIWAISQGGPGDATTTLPVYAFRIAQSLQKYDLGSAISMITVLLLTVILLAYFRMMFKQEREL